VSSAARFTRMYAFRSWIAVTAAVPPLSLLWFSTWLTTKRGVPICSLVIAVEFSVSPVARIEGGTRLPLAVRLLWGLRYITPVVENDAPVGQQICANDLKPCRLQSLHGADHIGLLEARWSSAQCRPPNSPHQSPLSQRIYLVSHSERPLDPVSQW
jgi:hypothetical protein